MAASALAEAANPYQTARNYPGRFLLLFDRWFGMNTPVLKNDFEVPPSHKRAV
jgi:hypothetical protein